MDLIALCCKKCGSPITFGNSLICQCPSCGVPHALVGSDGGDLLHSVSFLPYTVRTDGKMDKPLKFLLAEKIREFGYITHEKRFSESDLRIDEDNKTVYNRYLLGNDDNDPFIVAKPRIEQEVVRTVYHTFRSNEEIMGDVPRCEDLMTISIVPVEVIDSGRKILAGYRVEIGVRLPRFEDQANEMSELIKEWFGIIPEVNLSNG